MKILLTNDDGIYGHGLRSIHRALCQAGHTVQVVAPLSEQSAVSSAITIRNALRIRKITEAAFEGIGVLGTPSDCVKLAVAELLEFIPDVVVSGINAGANVGTDILYSGTVAAACEAAHLDLPALALSFDSAANPALGALPDVTLDEYARYGVSLMEKMPWSTLPPKRVINVNFPAIPFHRHKGLAICSHSSTPWDNKYVRKSDQQGDQHWWLDWNVEMPDADSGSDRDRLSEGYVTLTPLRFSFTDDLLLSALADLSL